MLPGFRFVVATVLLAISPVVFGLGAAALLRVSHDQFASLSTAPTPREPLLPRDQEARQATLALLRVEMMNEQAAAAKASGDSNPPEAAPVVAEPAPAAASTSTGVTEVDDSARRPATEIAATEAIADEPAIEKPARSDSDATQAPVEPSTAATQAPVEAAGAATQAAAEPPAAVTPTPAAPPTAEAKPTAPVEEKTAPTAATEAADCVPVGGATQSSAQIAMLISQTAIVRLAQASGTGKPLVHRVRHHHKSRRHRHWIGVHAPAATFATQPQPQPQQLPRPQQPKQPPRPQHTQQLPRPQQQQADRFAVFPTAR